MTFWKTTFLSFAAVLGITSTVFLSSCVKDSCLDLNCKNGGSCAEGFCRCPTGFEGAECELRLADRFVGTFNGTSTCGNFPRLADTVYINHTTAPDRIQYSRSGRPGEVLEGLVQGNRLTFPTITGSNFQRTVTVVVQEKEITAYDETSINGGPAEICYFIGYRP